MGNAIRKDVERVISRPVKQARMTMNARAVGAWSLVAVLFAILVAAAYYAYQGLTFDSEFEMPAGGYVALAFGVLFSVVIGIGLMALMFYSSRSGYDEPAQRESDDPNAGTRRSDQG